MPSRKQRNQPSNRVHDIEFATEISTSLLAQVRQLQSVLAERDETLKAISLEKSRLELEAEGFSQRLRSLDESEQRYKDENWSLETQTHDLIAASKEAGDREQRLQQALALLTSEKATAQRELDELKQANIKLAEEHIIFRRNHDSELGGLRKTILTGDNEKGALQRRNDELTLQNQELAKAVAGRFRSEDDLPTRDIGSEPEELSLDRSESEHSPPPSPSKGAVRHSMLESETLKSSLHHAHRMIQNLKSNVYREKTEKLELKRLLQESRDELDARKSEINGAANGNKRLKRKSQPDLARKGARPIVFGLGRSSTTDIEVEEAGWEDHDEESSPNQVANARLTRGPLPMSASKLQDVSDAYQTANETEDAFETANEHDVATETEAFQTGAESMAGDSSDGLTETEGDLVRNGTIRGMKHSSKSGPKASDRASFISTASTSASEDEYEAKTPVPAQPQRYRLKINRGSRRSRIGSEGPTGSTPSSMKNSPASFMSTTGQNSQSLFAELGGLDDGENDEVDGTPSRVSIISQRSTPGSRPSTAKQNIVRSVEQPLPPLPMVGSSMMTEPWEATEPTRKEYARGAMTDPQGALGNNYGLIQPAPITPHTRDIGSQRSPLGDTVSVSTSTSPPRAMWDQPFESFAGSIPTFGPALMSTPSSRRPTISHETNRANGSPMAVSSVSPIQNSVSNRLEPDERSFSRTEKETVSPGTPFSFSFSSIRSLETSPAEPTPFISSRDLRSPANIKEVSDIPVTQSDAETKEVGKGGILNSVLEWTKGKRQSTPQIAEDSSSHEPEMPFEIHRSRAPFQEVPTNIVQQSSDSRIIPQSSKAVLPVDTSDQSSQTTLSANQIDKLLEDSGNKSVTPANKVVQRPSSLMMMKPLSEIGALSPPLKRDNSQDNPKSPSRSPSKVIEPAALREAAPLVKTIRRPGSSGSIRAQSATYPPLPPDHRKAIAAAAQRVPAPEAASTSMGPPLAPASAYRSANNRSRTPSEQRRRSPSPRTGGTTRRPRYSSARSQVSRRSSFSSFASELDERFNIRTDGLPMPQEIESGADPRMIQAITQTMIGEYLWKYTRKAGRGEMSDNRHRRFFWVHPYTRTLYWSEQDPATAGRAQLKAKSVAIEAVRVVKDDNPFPPGLHRKSLVIITPGRAVKITATTGQRHETWFNALSYLLLRTGPDSLVDDPNAMTTEDVAEFNPSLNGQGLNSRTGRSRVSLASYRSHTSRNPSRTGSRTTSPMRAQSSLSTPGLEQATEQQASTTSRQPHQAYMANQGSFSSRFSSYWRPAIRSSKHGSISSQRSMTSLQQAANIDNASTAHDSAEDLRRVIERQEHDADRLENVRACCDGG